MFCRSTRDAGGRTNSTRNRRARAVWARLRQLDRNLASVPTGQSVWPDNGSQRLGRILGQFDPDALLKPVFDYTPRAQNVVPFDLLNGISVTHRSSSPVRFRASGRGEFNHRSPRPLLSATKEKAAS